MSIEQVVHEGVIVEDDRNERFCQGVVESMTEYDWSELPEELRVPLRAWVKDLRGWMLENP